MKRCTGICRRWKEPSDFYRDASKSDKRMNICKECVDEGKRMNRIVRREKAQEEAAARQEEVTGAVCICRKVVENGVKFEALNPSCRVHWQVGFDPNARQRIDPLYAAAFVHGY